MVTKGIITSIDFNGNTCKVRIPFFETAGNDPIVGDAIISNTPGSYNGYKVNDVVLVAFEDGQMNNPVVIGKLYLGVAKEKQDPRGTVNAETTTASKSASLPADSTLTANVDSNVPNTNTPYGSLASIANNLNSLNTDVNQLDKFTRNQFNSIITEIGEEGELWTAIRQNSREITLEAGRRKAGDDSLAEDYNTKFSVQDDKIDARVTKTLDVDDNHWEDPEHPGRTVGFGWDLTDKAWTVQSYDSSHTGQQTIDIFKVDNSGVTIAGDLKLVGYPSITITKYANVPADWYKSEDPRPGWITIDGTTSSAKAPDYDSLETIVNLVWTQEDVDAAPEDAPVVLNEKVWQEVQPAFNDNYYTWKLTYCLTYEYNSDTGLLDEILANQSVFCIYYKTKSSGPQPHDRRPPKRDEISLAEVYGIAKNAQGTADDAVDAASNAADTAHALAQGKTTNYYSELEPYAANTAPSGYLAAPNLKKGDCWFDTSDSGKYNETAIELTGASSENWELPSDWNDFPDVYRFNLVKWNNTNFSRYADSTNTRGIGKLSRGEWIKSGGFSSIKTLSICFYGETYTSETTSRLILLIPKTDTVLENGTAVPVTTIDRLRLWFAQMGSITVIYQNWSRQANILKQAKTDPDATTHRVEWEDIGGELVANKITANYINALDITTKKITVKDTSQNIIFEADSTTNRAKMGGLEATKTSLVYKDASNTKLLELGDLEDSIWGENIYAANMRLDVLQFGRKNKVFAILQAGDYTSGIDLGGSAGGALYRRGFRSWSSLCGQVAQVHEFEYDNGSFTYKVNDEIVNSSLSLTAGVAYKINASGSGTSVIGEHCFDWISHAVSMTTPTTSSLNVEISCNGNENKIVTFMLRGTLKSFKIIIFGCTQKEEQWGRW